MKRTTAIVVALATLVSSIAFAGKPGADKPGRDATLAGMHIYAAGEPIGALFAFFPVYVYEDLLPEIADHVSAVSPTGYSFMFRLWSGHLWPMWSSMMWSGPNCTGDLYVGDSSSGLGPSWAAQGFVFAVLPTPGNSIGAYYIPRESEPIDGTFLSRSHPQEATGSANCENTSPSSASLYRAYPNDPTITGVPGILFAKPITFGIP